MSAELDEITRDSLMLDTPYAAPTSETEAVVARIWSEAFGISDLGIDDDFFDLGGNSLMAETITRRISEKLGVALKTGSLVEANTVRQVVELIQGKAGPALPSHVVALNSHGNRVPLFIVHGAAGILFPSSTFMDGFHDDQPVYAFQVPGYDGETEPLATVEEIAADYLQCMKLVSPGGPWHLAGFCHGSWIAFEIACQMRAEGKQPRSLTLLDPGVQGGRMHDEFMREVTRKHGGLLTGLKMGAKRLVDTVRCYRATGRWIDPSNPHAYDIPEVWDYIQVRNRKRLSKAMLRDRIPENDKLMPWMADRDETYENEREMEIRRSPEANEAAEKLKHAFHKYSSDTPLDMPVHMVASKFQNARLDDPSYPLRKLMPRLNVTVLGEYHHDTISTKSVENALIIQSVVDNSEADFKGPGR